MQQTLRRGLAILRFRALESLRLRVGEYHANFLLTNINSLKSPKMNYSTLKTVAAIFNIIGVLQIIGSVFGVLIVTANVYNEQAKTMILAGGVLLAFLSVIWFAMAQFIKLLTNAALQIENIDSNVYLIANKVQGNN